MTEVSDLFLCGKTITERLMAMGCMCKRRSCRETLNIGVKILCKKKVAKQGKKEILDILKK
jgi:hypothetical protein